MDRQGIIALFCFHVRLKFFYHKMVTSIITHVPREGSVLQLLPPPPPPTLYFFPIVPFICLTHKSIPSWPAVFLKDVFIKAHFQNPLFLNLNEAFTL